MNSTKFNSFCAEVEKAIRTTFHAFLQQSVADELAVTSKHLRLQEMIDSGPKKKKKNEESDFGLTPGPIWFEVRLPRCYSKRFLIKYSILSWFLPELTAWELRETIRRRASEKQYYEIECYIYSKDCCMLALFQEVDLRHSDLFGNLLKSSYTYIRPTFDKQQEATLSQQDRVKRKVADFCSLLLVRPKKSLPKTFRRGYNDHGSKAPDDVRIRREEFQKDIFNTLEHEEIELRKVRFALQQRTRIHEILARGCSP